MSTSKVAVVTGANKGIGFAIVQGLCQRFNGQVYLTARDQQRGQKAVNDLKALGFNPLFHQLDISDQQSLRTFADHLKNTHGGLDLLINNAAIAFKGNSTEPFHLQAEETMRINYFALASACDILFPVLRSGARVVNLSSSAGHLSRIPGPELRDRFKNPNLTRTQLDQLAQEFVDSAKKGTNVESGWGSSAYTVSKVAATALTRIQSKEFGPKNISVNCVHPGYVDTDMTSHKGPKTIEEGADAPLYLALDVSDDVKGVYMWEDRSIVEWTSDVLQRN